MAEETKANNGISEEPCGESPVCIRCFRPVDPLAHYCPNCGAATGQFTHYLPVESIRWQASVWGQAWRQIRDPDVSLAGRLFRLLMIVWNVPIMLIGLLFRSADEPQDSRTADSEEPMAKGRDGKGTE